ncbi:MAG: ABC transporter permease [Acidobacteriota bacterium]|nr:ABC transporter permease [Acidobacteriota bacterium]
MRGPPLFRRLRLLFRDRRAERELDAEMQLHLELLEAQFRDDGFSPREARRRARLAFGSRESVRAQTRDAHGLVRTQEFLDDVGHALRALRRTPAFATVAVSVLALGIGATIAIFSVLSASLLRPVPFPDGHRVVSLAWNYGDHVFPSLTSAKFSYWREHTRSFAAIASWQAFFGRVGEVGEITGAQGLRVTDGFFRVVGMPPAVGRAFTEDEYQPGGRRVALVSPGFWRRHFGEPVDVSGRASIKLEEEPYAIVGLLPEDFAFPYVPRPVEMVIPTAVEVDPDDQGANWPAIARVRDDATMSDARTEVTWLNAGFRAAYPQQAGEEEPGMAVGSFAELYAGQTSSAIWILMGAVAAVLLIACANVGSLFLVRALRRRGEMAIRGALGATESRILRLGVAEAVVVAFAAGAAGLLLAIWGAGVLVALAPVQLPLAGSIGIDWRVVAFAIGVSLMTSVVVSVVAAWPRLRGGLWRALRRSSRTTTGQSRLQEALLSVQTALSMILLVGALLLSSTWSTLRQTDPGFDPDALIAAQLPIRPPNYDTSERLDRFAEGVIQGMRSRGVADVAGASSLPFERGLNFPMSIAGRAEFGGSVELRVVTEGYFRTLGIPVVRGRSFTPTDAQGSPPVAIVNETFARRYFPDGSAIGQRIDLGRMGSVTRYASLKGRGVVIVGVAADVQDVSFRTAVRRTIYLPQAQTADVIANIRPEMPVFVVRSVLPVQQLEREFRQVIRAVDPALPAAEVFPLSETVADSLARERFGTILVSLFGVLALILTAVGVYSVLAQTVRSRHQEIAIRMAVGASGDSVLRLVVARGLLPVAIGIGFGLVGAVALSGVVEAYLWGVTGTDALTLSIAAAGILAVAAFACWIPAREAARVDPARALGSY